MSKYGSEKHILHLSITWQQNKIIQLGSKMKVLAKLAAASCYIIQEHQTCIPMANSCMAKPSQYCKATIPSIKIGKLI